MVLWSELKSLEELAFCSLVYDDFASSQTSISGCLCHLNTKRIGLNVFTTSHRVEMSSNKPCKSQNFTNDPNNFTPGFILN